jgi:hypothetical protein
MNRLLLIDGDLLAYRTAAAAEKETDWGEGMMTLHADAGLAIDNMELHDLVNLQRSLTPTNCDLPV